MILNKQKKVRLATRPLHAFLQKTKRELDIAGSEITVALVSDEEIARWNEQYRRKKGPTDVLSFPAMCGARHKKEPTDVLPLPAVAGARRQRPAKKNSRKARGNVHSFVLHNESEPDKILGDIAIAPETAKRYARKNGRTLARELRVLILHGVLHLMGFDHETDEGQMNCKEQKLRRRMGIA